MDVDQTGAGDEALGVDLSRAAAFGGGEGVDEAAVAHEDVADGVAPGGGVAGEERLLFRSGRLVRVEQLRGGKAHGMAVDFDGSGRVVAVRTWVDGVERGPWFEVAPSGVVERSGVVE